VLDKILCTINFCSRLPVFIPSKRTASCHFQAVREANDPQSWDPSPDGDICLQTDLLHRPLFIFGSEKGKSTVPKFPDEQGRFLRSAKTDPSWVGGNSHQR
jgi:hypothetical protein